MIRRPPRSTRTDYLFPYPTRFRSWRVPISSHLCSVMASLEIVPGGDTNPGPVANGHNCDFMPLVFHCKNLRGGRANEDVRRFGRNDSPKGKAEPFPARLSLQLNDA